MLVSVLNGFAIGFLLFILAVGLSIVFGMMDRGVPPRPCHGPAAARPGLTADVLGGHGRHGVMLGASAPPGGVPDEQQREEAEVRDPSRSGHQYR
jgi:hypothetical protein